MWTAKTERMPRLICVFTGRTGHFVGFVMLRLISAISEFIQTKVEHVYEVLPFTG